MTKTKTMHWMNLALTVVSIVAITVFLVNHNPNVDIHASWWVWSGVFFILLFNLFNELFGRKDFVSRLPNVIQRPFYRIWKRNLLKINISPLIAYPFHAFVSLNLDQYFEEGGIALASQKVEEFVDELPSKTMSVLKGMIADEQTPIPKPSEN